MSRLYGAASAAFANFHNVDTRLGLEGALRSCCVGPPPGTLGA